LILIPRCALDPKGGRRGGGRKRVNENCFVTDGIDPGSFRDPAGRVLRKGGRVFRLVRENGWRTFSKVWEPRLIDDLAAEDLILPLTMSDAAAAGAQNGACRVFETGCITIRILALRMALLGAQSRGNLATRTTH
jgi:hypothetical protein